MNENDGFTKAAKILAWIPNAAIVFVIAALFWYHQYSIAWCFLLTQVFGIGLFWFAMQKRKKQLSKEL